MRERTPSSPKKWREAIGTAVENGVEYINQRRRTALALTLLLSGGGHAALNYGVREHAAIEQSVQDHLAHLEDDVIKARRVVDARFATTQANIDYFRQDPLGFLQQLGHEPRTLNNPESNPLFQDLMAGNERQHDLSDFYFTSEVALEHISQDDLEAAQRQYEVILSGARKMQERGATLEEIFPYIWSYTGKQGLEDDSFIDLLVRPNTKGKTCAARYKFIASIVEDLYPGFSEEGRLYARVFGSWEDEKGVLHRSHIQLVVDDDQGSDLLVLDGGAAQREPDDPTAPKIEAHVYALSQLLVTSGVTDYTTLGMSDPQGARAVDPTEIDGLPAPTSRGKHTGSVLDEVPAPAPMSVEQAIQLLQPMSITLLDEESEVGPMSSELPTPPSQPSPEAQVIIESMDRLRAAYVTFPEGDFARAEFGRGSRVIESHLIIPSYTDPRLQALLPDFQKIREQHRLSNAETYNIGENLKGYWIFEIPSDQPIPDEWLAIMAQPKALQLIEPQIVLHDYPSEELWWQLYNSMLKNKNVYNGVRVYTDRVAPPEFLKHRRIPKNARGKGNLSFLDVQSIDSVAHFPMEEVRIYMDNDAAAVDIARLEERSANVFLYRTRLTGTARITGERQLRLYDVRSIQPDTHFFLDSYGILLLTDDSKKPLASGTFLSTIDTKPARLLYYKGTGIESEAVGIQTNKLVVEIRFSHDAKQNNGIQARAFAGSSGKGLELRLDTGVSIDPRAFVDSNFAEVIVSIHATGDSSFEDVAQLIMDVRQATQQLKSVKIDVEPFRHVDKDKLVAFLKGRGLM